MKNILFASSECVPFIKTGGLADVVGSLPKYFDKTKYDVRVVLPRYNCMFQKWKDMMEYVDHFYMNLAGEDRYVGIMKCEYEGITFYFIDNEYYFNGFAPYDGDPKWNIEKFAFFSKAVLSILPRELVKLSDETVQSEIGKDVLIFEKAQRLPLMITTDSVCDLPESLIKEFNISICPYYVCTDHGRFLDEREIKADELLPHLLEGDSGFSQPPDVIDYERFFAENLTETQNIIHIAMAKHASDGYANAKEAAKSFENVTVIDSGHLSSSLGLIVLYAASMAENHATRSEVVKTVKYLRRYISSAFIIDSTHMMCQSGHISKKIQILCDALLLHPIIVLRKSKMVVGSIEMGNFAHVAKRYVRKVLLHPRNIDTRILFITYAGIDEKSLKYIQDLVQQYCPFERVYLQKASSAIACNCGPGSFGLLFMKKNDALITFSESSKTNMPE